MQTQETVHQQADKIVRHYSLAGLGVGVIPFPWVDMAALVGVQLKMLHRLAQLYQIEFQQQVVKSAISSLLSSYVPLSLSSSSKLIPGVGSALSLTLQPPACAAATYAVGKVFTQHFASGGTFLDFDPQQVRDYFVQQYQQNPSELPKNSVSTPQNPTKP